MKVSYLAFVVAALFVLAAIPHESIPQERKRPRRPATATRETAKPLEPPVFWSALANDEKVETWRRSLAIYFLFDRHVKQDVALGELAKLLDHPKWLREEGVVEVTKVAGYIPLFFTPGDTMFSVVVFRNKDAARDRKEAFGIYLNVTGTIGKKDFVSTITGRKKGKYEKTRLRAWAIYPAWPQFVKRAPH